MEERVLGVGTDIGGSHITAGLFDLTNRSLIDGSIERRKVNSQGKTEEIIEVWANCISATTDEIKRTDKIGLALPGPFDYEAGVAQGLHKYGSLYQKNVKELLAERLNCDVGNIEMANDAACFLKGEMMIGVGKDNESGLGITLGTGIGSAMFKNDVSYDACLWEAPFKAGIAENYFSTQWFVDEFYKLTEVKVAGTLQIVQWADLGIVESIFDSFANNLVEFLTPILEKNRPEILILGGSIAKASAWFLPKVQKKLLNAQLQIAIEISKLGEMSAMAGSVLPSNRLAFKDQTF